MAKTINREVGEISVKLDELINRTDKGFTDITQRLDTLNGSVRKHELGLVQFGDWRKNVDKRHNSRLDQGLSGWIRGVLFWLLK